jgi:hypothetical protein
MILGLIRQKVVPYHVQKQQKTTAFHKLLVFLGRIVADYRGRIDRIFLYNIYSRTALAVAQQTQ